MIKFKKKKLKRKTVISYTRTSWKCIKINAFMACLRENQLVLRTSWIHLKYVFIFTITYVYTWEFHILIPSVYKIQKHPIRPFLFVFSGFLSKRREYVKIIKWKIAQKTGFNCYACTMIAQLKFRIEKTIKLLINHNILHNSEDNNFTVFILKIIIGIPRNRLGMIRNAIGTSTPKF